MESIIATSNLSWETPTGFDQGIEQAIINNTLDEINKIGIRTRFVRFSPGARTTTKFIHDYHEEVYIVEGDQILLDEDNLAAKERYAEGRYFLRPAGTFHGPFSSKNGCLLLEIHYY